METVNPARKRARVWFWVALLTSISFVGGIVMIPLCAVAKLWALMGIGIAFCVHGFYGTVFYWEAFAKYRRYSSFTDAVMRDGLCTVEELSGHFGLKRELTVRKIRECIEKDFLPGYRFDGEKLQRIIRPQDGAVVVECPCCGAKNLITEKNRFCEYCGGALSFPSEK